MVKYRNLKTENVDITIYPQKAKNKDINGFWCQWYNGIKSEIKSLIRAF